MSSKSVEIVDRILKQVDKFDKDEDEKSTESTLSSRHFMRNNANLINDAIDGTFLTSSTNNTTRIFTNDSSIKVVLRSDFDGDKEVALIAGGGSGHEPSHAGFVGQGMLTAVVCGEIFASPPTKAVVAALKAVGGSQGVLIILKNYTGDILCFTLASKIAKAKYNIESEIIIIGDDTAIGRDKAGRVGRRGVAGTVFIHKIAGHLAQKGAKLNDIKSYLEKNIVPNLGSIGIAATSCYLPGTGMVKKERINSNEIELGLGIHGEPGAKTIAFDRITTLIPQMFEILYDADPDRDYIEFLSKKSATPHDIVLMINNLGGTTPMEMGVILKYVLLFLNEDKTHSFNVHRVFCGPYMTALDMKGFSVTLLRVNNEILTALDASVGPRAWIPGQTVDIKTLIHGTESVEDDVKQKEDVKLEDDVLLSDNGALILRKFIKNACAAIQTKKDELNALDAKVGDGDCGRTLDLGAGFVIAKIDTFNFKSLYCALRDVGETLADMGATSGAIYGYLFVAAATRIKEECKDNNVNGLTVSKALLNAVDDLSAYSGAKAGNRTMLDALYPAVNELNAYYQKNDGNGDVNEAVKLAVNRAKQGVEATKTMKPMFGRSCWIPLEKLKDSPDPGAVAVATWMESLVD